MIDAIFVRMNCYKTFTAVGLSRPLKVINKRGVSTSSVLRDDHSCRLLVIGGGAGGCSVAAKYANKLGKNRVIVIDPADTHYYQAMFTMIGAGIKDLGQSRRAMKDVLPKNALWIKDTVTEIEPKKNKVYTENGHTIDYDYMVVATGIELDWHKIPGLLDGLKDPYSGVCSNYSPLFVEKTFKCMKELKSGNAIFTYPNGPVKCAGAPQKIAYLTADHALRHGKKGVQVIYHTTLPVIFKCDHYAEALWKVAERKNIEVHLNSELVEVRPDRKEAIFKNLETQLRSVQQYEMLHVTPPQYPSPLISENKEISDASGFLAIDKCTMQHLKYPNIFGVGDCTSLPTSKTGAAVAGQLGVLRRNLTAVMRNQDPKAAYDGYTSCPLVTGYNTCIMAEFDYDLKPLETFPIDQSIERHTMYFMKKDVMPNLYFELMLRGFWEGPGMFRKMMHLGMSK